MGRSLDDVLASLPKGRRARVEARARVLKDEVESLGELRRAAIKAQVDIAAALKVKQPSVSKIERQTDMYLSTLRRTIEAIGGKLELIVRLPSRKPLRIERLGEIASGADSARTGKRTSKRRAKPKAGARAG
jgi:Helix-turn-helix domain